MDQHSNNLYILWTNDNPVNAEKVVFMYAFNALQEGWWENVTIIAWGATVQLTVENTAIQQQIRKMIAAGISFSASKSCADQLGAAEKLEQIGIEVIFWGKPLTDIIKSGQRLLTI